MRPCGSQVRGAPPLLPARGLCGARVRQSQAARLSLSERVSGQSRLPVPPMHHAFPSHFNRWGAPQKPVLELEKQNI